MRPHATVPAERTRISLTPHAHALRLTGVALTAAVWLSLTSCGAIPTGADNSEVAFFGIPDTNAILFVSEDHPAPVKVYDDQPPAGPPPQFSGLEDDPFLRTDQYFRAGAGARQLLLMDGTIANGYAPFRKRTDGTMEACTDYLLRPERKWLPSQWECYRFSDLVPATAPITEYGCRGALDGRMGSRSPLSAIVGEGSADSLRSFFFIGEFQPAESLFHITWTPVERATAVWIHVYRFKITTSREEVILSGIPNPVLSHGVEDVLIARIPADGTNQTYIVGQPASPLITWSPPRFEEQYLVRVTAVNERNQIVGKLVGANGLFQDSTTYSRFTLGAVLVEPTRRTTGVTRPKQPAGLRSAFGIRGLSVANPSQSLPGH